MIDAVFLVGAASDATELMNLPEIDNSVQSSGSDRTKRSRIGELILDIASLAPFELIAFLRCALVRLLSFNLLVSRQHCKC